MAEASQTSSANAAQTQAPTKASVVVDLRPFSELKTRFIKLVSALVEASNVDASSIASRIL